jgi:CHAT domain
VRSSAWQREGTRNPRAVGEVVSLSALRPGLEREGYALVSIVTHGGQWHAALVDGKRVEHHVLGSAQTTQELVRRVRSDLDALALPMIPEQIRRSVTASLQGGLAALDALVLGPLHVKGRNLVVSPGGSMAILPWGLMPSRRGLPVVVSPNASSWLQAVEQTATDPQKHPAGEPRVAAIAGPGLSRAEAEARAVAGTWSGTAMTGPGASTRAVTTVLGTHDIVHVAAHGTHDLESPLFSSLRLVDGPLFAHELDVARQMASCVVLSACELGLSTLRPGNEALGLTSVLLHLGARSVLAGVGRVADDVAAEVMEHTHQLMAAGVDSATALARAQVAVSRNDAPAPFVCFGSSWTASRRATAAVA